MLHGIFCSAWQEHLHIDVHSRDLFEGEDEGYVKHICAMSPLWLLQLLLTEGISGKKY